MNKQTSPFWPPQLTSILSLSALIFHISCHMGGVRGWERLIHFAWQAMERMGGIDRACVVSRYGEIRLWNAWAQDKTPLKAGSIDIWNCCHLRLKTPSVTMLWGQTVLAYQNAPQIPVSHQCARASRTYLHNRGSSEHTAGVHHPCSVWRDPVGRISLILEVIR